MGAGHKSASPAVSTEPTAREAEEALRELTAAIKNGTATPELASQVSIRANARFADLDAAIKKLADWIQTRKLAGALGGSRRKDDAAEAAKPIYEVYKAIIAAGVPGRKAMGETARRLQRTAKHANLDVRQVRRAVNRMIAKGGNS